MRAWVFIVPLAAILASGCDPGWEISATFVVPAATQQRVGPYPMQLLVTTGGPPPDLVAVLCAPSSEPFVAHVTLSGIGPECMGEMPVEAWLAPIEAGVSPCGVRKHPLFVDRCGTVCAPKPGEPVGRALAFDDGGCQSRDHVEIDIVF